jgi:predicted ATPase
MARHAMVFTLFYLGELSEALHHAEEGCSLFSLEQEWAIVGIIQLSSTAVMRGIQAICFALQGRAPESARAVEQGLSLIAELGHPPSTAVHLSLSSELLYWQHDSARLSETSERLMALAQYEGFQLYLGAARCYRGWAKGRMGELAAGRADMEVGLREYDRCGAKVNFVHARWGLADLLARSGLTLEAIGVLDDAFRDSESRGETNCDSELHRLRGELLVQARGESDEARAHLRKAGDIAHGQGAHLLEQRAASTLAALEDGLIDSGRISSPDVTSYEKGESRASSRVSERRGI